jgi:hypothetical protein
MKLFFSQLAYFFNQSRERNVQILLKFVGLLAALIGPVLGLCSTS